MFLPPIAMVVNISGDEEVFVSIIKESTIYKSPLHNYVCAQASLLKWFFWIKWHMQIRFDFPVLLLFLSFTFLTSLCCSWNKMSDYEMESGTYGATSDAYTVQWDWKVNSLQKKSKKRFQLVFIHSFLFQGWLYKCLQQHALILSPGLSSPSIP